jgi:EEF1A N-terminal glycine/lysine methyltransferase
VILSDLLHFDSGHDSLIESVKALLKRAPSSHVHVSAGRYTRTHVCDSFLAKSKAVGLEFEEVQTNPEEGWMGTMPVNTLDKEALALRKEACRYWIGRWHPSHL